MCRRYSLPTVLLLLAETYRKTHKQLLEAALIWLYNIILHMIILLSIFIPPTTAQNFQIPQPIPDLWDAKQNWKELQLTF
jgi:hypothetical protein